jgi:dihydrofolate reductase
MGELIVDFITSLDGYASAEGWPGWWGLEGPDYLAWLDQRPNHNYTILMGANTYRLMHGFASAAQALDSNKTAEADAMAELTQAPKVVFSSTLEAPLAWPNTQLVSGDPAKAVAEMKRSGARMRTLGSLTLCRSLLEAGLVDRFRVGEGWRDGARCHRRSSGDPLSSLLTSARRWPAADDRTIRGQSPSKDAFSTRRHDDGLGTADGDAPCLRPRAPTWWATRR